MIVVIRLISHLRKNLSALRLREIKIKFLVQSPKKSPKINVYILKVANDRQTPADKDGNAFRVHHCHHTQSIYLMVSGWFNHSLQLSATYCSTVNYRL